MIHHPDDGLAFERIVNVPRRGIGAATLKTIHVLARAQSVSLSEAASRLVETDEITARARNALRGFTDDCARWRVMAQALDHIELAENVLDESGYTEMWKNDKSVDAPGRLENLKELVSALAEFDSLGGFLEHIGLVMDRDAHLSGDMLSLMTLHAAKGLEFEHVFLPGWEEDVFPNKRSVDDGGTAALEEERRLAYVGLTRAKLRAHVSFAASRRIYNQWLSCIPSRFIDELPGEHVEIISDQGLYGGQSGFAAAAAWDQADWQPVKPGRGPGYQRLRDTRRGDTRRGGAETVIEGRAELVERAGGIAVGVRVFHQKFGRGTVTASDGGKLEIEFEKAGAKKVMESFVEPV